MAVGSLLFLAVLAIVHHPLLVSDTWDPATVQRRQQQEQLLALEMKQLQLEFEQRNQEEQQEQGRAQSPGPEPEPEPEPEPGWVEQEARLQRAGKQGPNHIAWDRWHCGLLLLLLLLELCRPSKEHAVSDDSSSSEASSEEEEEEEEEAEAGAAPRGSCPQSPGFPDTEALECFYQQHLPGLSEELAGACELVASLVTSLLEVCRVLTCQTALPQPENGIGVGSAFEGWCPRRDPSAYHVLVPLLPPKGYSFHLELESAPGALEKHGRILLELECVCKRQRLLGDVRCLLHQAEHGASSGEPGPCHVHILCTRSHLDVEKTTLWFQSLVGKAWELVSHSYSFQLAVQPSASSCKLRLAHESGGALSIELVLAVQQGDSLIFLASQGVDAGPLSSLLWVETFAVQEMLFFQLVNRYAPQGSCHLKCLQILLHLQERRLSSPPSGVLTAYHLKTALMHLLLLRPLSQWCPLQLAHRLQDVLWYLCRALEEKRLDHFLIGNSALPSQLPVPTAVRSAQPLNLFGPLAQAPAAHAQARSELLEVVQEVRALSPAYSK